LKTQEKPNRDRAVLLKIDEKHQGQRLDNFLCNECKGVPKSHVFRIIRSGEVRINSKRAEAKTKLCLGDMVRIPPIQVTEKQMPEIPCSSDYLGSTSLIKAAKAISILFEDDHILVVNKPSGMAVHGGSGSSLGVIEYIRAIRAGSHEDLDLVHRIDRETSGILIISKKRSALRKLQEQLRARSWRKFYKTLVLGKWPESLIKVDLPLLKTQTTEKEARVFVDPSGDSAHSKFKVLQCYKSEYAIFTLLQVQIMTGRTHQIRVHTSASKFPIAGDDRYGNFETNKQLARHGLKRMFLHSARLQLTHPHSNENMVLEAPLPLELDEFLKTLKAFTFK
jgi:23S rRNA pseudouridine955/2504/2580 synthase